MENEKPNYWRMKNEDYAAMTALYQVRGYLKASKKAIEPKDLLDYIEQALAEETDRLNKAFPEKKAPQKER